MPSRWFSASILFTISLVPACLAQTAAPAYFSVPAPDAPELARRGPYSVGVRTLNLVHRGQIDILHFDKASGKAPLYDRPLTIEIWYPAIIPPGKTETTVYESPLSDSTDNPVAPKSFPLPGKALRDAPPVPNQTFPLVIVSHGYPGSRTFLSYLTENLASKGYLVAAIDHTDSVSGAVRDFSSTLLNRSNDQLFTIQTLSEQSAKPGSFLNGLLDPIRVAVIGYSMGGYGALATAGAGYSKTAAANKFVPGGSFDAWTADSPQFKAIRRDNIKAIVAIAPWGNQPPYNSWTEAGLAGIHIPSLFIVGDQDDVSGFDPGVKPAFDAAVNSDRCLLIYENARHNVGGNPPPPGLPLDFEALQHYDEPVWRKDRITAINQHFITAFLDLYLKGDQSRLPYLHVLPEKSNDGKWPLKTGEEAGASFSGGSQDGQAYWKGFERRWAVGLELHCQAPASTK